MQQQALTAQLKTALLAWLKKPELGKRDWLQRALGAPSTDATSLDKKLESRPWHHKLKKHLGIGPIPEGPTRKACQRRSGIRRFLKMNQSVLVDHSIKDS